MKRYLAIKFLAMIAAASLAGFFAGGCTMQDAPDPTTRPLNDPFDNTDITGGSTTNFDSKAFKKDVNNAINP